MKIKGLLLGMFACAALVACTDNDITESIPDVNNNKSEKAEAYLTFSVAASGNSSRAVENTGDNHGGAEDSKHYNTGTANENKVKSIMIVFYNEDNEAGDGVAAVYNISEDGTSTGLTKNSDGSYSPTTPYQLSTTGTYKTLVIINPNATIATQVGNGASTVKTIYNDILEGTNSTIANIIGTDKDAFMMTNKKEATIEVTVTNNSPMAAATPTDGPIEVERVASKITFRPTTLTPFTAAGSLKSGENVYKVNASHTTYAVNTTAGWVPAGNSYIYYTRFNEATTNEANPSERRVIYVLLNNGTTTFYTKGLNHTGYLNGTETTAPVMNPFDFNGKPIYQGIAGNPVDVPYYVRLERYALVNLNNSVYNVRHTNADPASVTGAKVFGTVGSSNYLYEPNTLAKSNVDFTDWNAATSGNTWFGNTTLYNVETAIKNNDATLNTYFKALPSTNNDNNEYDGGDGSVTGTTPEAENVGSGLAYCMENAVVSSKQDARLTTGIFFEAQIYDTNGSPVSCMYKYETSFYKDLKSLNEATGNQFEEYLDENNENGELDESLSRAGVEIFRDGKCYYFSSEIKHFDDNNSAAKGVMEYAIMRNNIYSLAVGSVDGFGFSSTEIVPGETDGGDGDQSVYLTLTAKIVPWIVRFNNIEF